jgi:hypothetical protein
MLKRERRMSILLLIPLIVAGTVLSSELGEKKSRAKRNVELEGKAVCIGCDLKKSEGFHAQCKVYGHKHVLLGKDGRYYSFLENDRSEKLINGEGVHGKNVRVKGDLMPEAQYVDVMSYSVEDGDGKWMEIAWCNVCSKMDKVEGHIHKKKREMTHEHEGKHEHEKGH